MFYNLLNMLDKKFNFVTVSAKSACETYDPLPIQLAVITMVRNTDLIIDLQHKSYLTTNEQLHYSQLLSVKLDNCEKIKNEFLMLWKHLNIELTKEKKLSVDSLLNDTFINIELNSHQIDKKLSRHLLSVVNNLVAMYWCSQGVKTYIAQCLPPINYNLCLRC